MDIVFERLNWSSHGLERLYQRFSITPDEVRFLLENNLYVFGGHEKTKRYTHYLCYSHIDDEPFVVVISQDTYTIVTILKVMYDKIIHPISSQQLIKQLTIDFLVKYRIILPPDKSFSEVKEKIKLNSEQSSDLSGDFPPLIGAKLVPREFAVSSVCNKFVDKVKENLRPLTLVRNGITRDDLKTDPPNFIDKIAMFKLVGFNESGEKTGIFNTKTRCLTDFFYLKYILHYQLYNSIVKDYKRTLTFILPKNEQGTVLEYRLFTIGFMKKKSLSDISVFTGFPEDKIRS